MALIIVFGVIELGRHLVSILISLQRILATRTCQPVCLEVLGDLVCFWKLRYIQQCLTLVFRLLNM